MKSKANIKTHPIHPILVGFPIAFYTLTFLSDTWFLVSADGNFGIFASYLNLAGIVSALLAAVPGIVDYFYTVPPKSSASQRAAKHGILNVVVLLIFAADYFARRNGVNAIAITLIGFVGIVLTGIAGWLGGTLVSRNQIGVDIRFANAAKWSEARIDSKESRVRLASVDELRNDQMKLFHVNGKRIVLAKSDDRFFAFDDKCSHRGGSLAAGALICGTVQCPWHGSQFDISSGVAVAGPAKDLIATYALTVDGNGVFLEADFIDT